MEEKENVYGKTSGAEEITEVKESGEKRDDSRGKDALAALGKFKDVDALARAYESLQSEFTRRSQRLKELERQAENFARAEVGRSATGSGAEKLRKNAEARRAAAQEFDEFVAEVNAAHGNGRTAEPAEGELSEKNKDGGEDSESVGKAEEAVNVPETADSSEETEARMQRSEGAQAQGSDVYKGATGERTSPPVAESVDKGVSAEELYRQVCRDESVRLRIIGEYLSSVGKSAPPLTAKGVGTIATPPLKARNIGDAGTMALQYFKRP